MRSRLPQSREVWLISIGWHISALFLFLTLWLFQDFPELSFLALFVSIYVLVVTNRRLAERKLKARDKLETIMRKQDLEAVRQDLTTHIEAVRQDLTTHIDTTIQALAASTSKGQTRTIQEAYVASSAISNLIQKLNPRAPLMFTRGWSASPELLSHLYNVIIEKKPRFVLDLGSGMTTVVAGYALRKNGFGSVVAWEHLPEFADNTRKQVLQHDLQDWATVVCSPLKEIMIEGVSYLWFGQRLQQQQQVDLLVVDGPPGGTDNMARYPAGPIIGPSFSDDATLILDDVDRKDEQEIIRLWSRSFDWHPQETLGQQGKSLFAVYNLRS